MIPSADQDNCVRYCRGIAFVFDLDGVIVNSNPVHSRSWREYLRRVGIEPPEDFDQRMYGRRNDDIVRAVFGAGLAEDEALRHGAEKEKLYRLMMAPVLEAHLVPGIPGFLERHRAVPKAIATNGEQANLDFVLDRAGLKRYFPAALHGGLIERPKPHPEIYLRAAELLCVPPARCIVFEDSYAGVEAARAAGARVVGLATTHHDLAGVDLFIRDFLDPGLTSWLASQAPA